MPFSFSKQDFFQKLLPQLFALGITEGTKEIKEAENISNTIFNYFDTQNSYGATGQDGFWNQFELNQAMSQKAGDIVITKVTEFIDNNCENTNITGNREELDSWYLSDENMPTVAKNPLAKIWYSKYKVQNGELNYTKAVELLNNDSNLPNYIKIYIRTAFGICDGSVAENLQGGKGTCHLLSCRDELDDSDDLKYISENIVVQNYDGTVTVTFFGVTDEYGVPKKIIISNKEISQSYRTNNKSDGGSTDPDDAVLELAYQKLAKEIAQNYAADTEIIEQLREKQCKAILKNTLYSLEKKENKTEEETNLMNYLRTNLNDFENLQYTEIIKIMQNNNIYDSYIALMTTDSQEAKDIYNEIVLAEQKRVKIFQQLNIDIFNLANYDEANLAKSLGADTASSFKVLTGKDAQKVDATKFLPQDYDILQDRDYTILKQAYKEAADDFFTTTDIKKTPIVFGFREANEDNGIYTRHAYSLKDIFFDEKTNTKMVKFRNPHGYILYKPYDEFISIVEDITYL